MLGGSGRNNGANTAVVSVREAITNVAYSSDTVTKAATDGFTMYEQTFKVPASTAIKISVVHTSPPDNQGLFLDNVDLQCTSGEDVELFEVFEDNFEQESSTVSGTNYVLKNWLTTSGTIDLVGPVTTPYTGFKCAEGSGKCIDLDGTTSQGITMRTKETFSSTCPRVCKLQYSISGNQRSGPADTAVVSAIAGATTLSSASTTQAWDAPYKVVSQVFTAPSDTPFYIKVQETSNDNYGQIFDSLSLCCSRPTYHTIFREDFVDLPAPATGYTGNGLLTQWNVASGVHYDWKEICASGSVGACLEAVSFSMTTKVAHLSTKARCCKLSYDLKGNPRYENTVDLSIVTVETPSGNRLSHNVVRGFDGWNRNGWQRYEDEFSVPAGQAFVIKVNGVDSSSNAWGLLIDSIEVGCTITDDDSYPVLVPGTEASVNFKGYELLFRENFEDENDSAGSTNFAGLTQWNYLRGTIDTKGPQSATFKSFTCNKGTGKCIDLDGSTGVAGTIETKSSFVSETVQTCRLSYALSGSGRGDGSNTATISALNAYTGEAYSSQVHTIADTAAWATFDKTFEVPAGKPFRIRVAGSDRPNVANSGATTPGSDNMGLLFDDLTLQCRPKYESCALNTQSYTAFTFKLAFCFNNNDMQQILQRVNEFTQKIFYSYKQTSTVHFLVPEGCDVCSKVTGAMLLQSEDAPEVTCSTEPAESVLLEDSVIVTKRTFGLCNSAATCNQLATAHAGDSTYIQIDIRSNPSYDPATNPFSALQTADFARPFLCPNTPHAVPVSYYEKCTDSMQCRCQCPVGYDTTTCPDTGKLVCTKKVENCHSCAWLDTCYSFEQTQAQVNTCSINTPYTQGGPNLVPFPNDNYVGSETNQHEQTFMNGFDGYQTFLAQDTAGYDISCTYGKDVRLCKAECDNNPSCKAFNYVRPVVNPTFPNWGGNSGCCTKHLNGAPPSPIANPNVDFYLKVPKGPRIVLDMLKDSNANLPLKTGVFTWKDFEANRYTILTNFANYNKVGTYFLRLTAYDYANTPAVCETTVSIKDSYHPQPNPQCTHTCPGLVGPGALTTNNYSPATYSTGHTKVAEFLAWVNNLKNDVCGNNNDCSTHAYTASSFGSAPKVPIADAAVGTCLDITAADATAMQNFASTVSDTNPFPANFCKKCCELHYTAKETVAWWVCDKPRHTQTECQGTNAGICGYEGCFSTTSGNDFFSVTASIQPTVVADSQAVINDNFPGQGYLANTQVHHLLPCDYLSSNPNCHFPTTLGALFKTDASFVTGWGGVLPNLASNYVRFRYRINKGTWTAFDPAKPIDFTDLITCVEIQAYSACGFVGTPVSFYVYLHPHKTLDICFSLERLGWSQASTGLIDGTYCNIPHSNFGEFTFEFDTNKLQVSSFGTHLGYDFTSIECSVAYKKPDGTYSSSVQVITPTSHSVLEHFGVNFVDQPTTHALTELKMSCLLKFRSDAGAIISQTCDKTLTFHDCDEPGWDCPFGDCISKCTGNIKRSYQLCGGNEISYSSTLGAQFRSKYFENQACCSQCGASTCAPILDGALELQQCQPPASTADYNECSIPGTWNNVLQLAVSDTNVVSASFPNRAVAFGKLNNDGISGYVDFLDDPPRYYFVMQPDVNGVCTIYWQQSLPVNIFTTGNIYKKTANAAVVADFIALPEVMQQHYLILLGSIGTIALVAVMMVLTKKREKSDLEYALLHDDV